MFLYVNKLTLYDSLCSSIFLSLYLFMFLCFSDFFTLDEWIFYSTSLYFNLLMFLWFCCSLFIIAAPMCLGIRKSLRFLFLKIHIKNNQVLVRTYSCKVSQIDINNQVTLNICSRLWNRSLWLVTAPPKLLNKWNQQITRAQHLLHKFSQRKCKSGFCLLVSHLCLSWNRFCSNCSPWQPQNKKSDPNPLFLWIQMYL